MINSTPPDDWRDLQTQVARILDECGFEAEVEKEIHTARGDVKIDVFAEDSSQTPPATYLCECKLWQTNVPKSVVHSFRTVVSDFGANWGLIISSAGFQSGAYQAAEHSNVRLLTWHEFQELFEHRWLEEYFAPRIWEETMPLSDYIEPINSRIFSKADALTEEAREEFKYLRGQYQSFAFLALGFRVGAPDPRQIQLPLAGAGQDLMADQLKAPAALIQATAWREFLELYLEHAREGIEAFDRVFGERA